MPYRKRKSPRRPAEAAAAAREYVCDHDYCDLEECPCYCHKNCKPEAAEARDQLRTTLQAPADPPPERPHREPITEAMVDAGQAPIWALRMVRLAPGFYADRWGNVHISQAEVCRHFNVPPTRENLDTVVKAWNEACRKNFGEVPRITEVNE